MKHKLFSLLFAGIMGVLAVHAQTDYAKLGIERKVLFTMNKNEVCTYVGTYNPYKGVDSIKACEIFVYDTKKELETYIRNGERILSAEKIEPAHMNDAYDMPSKDSLVLMYSQDYAEYIRYGEKVFGPYSQVGYIGWNKFAFIDPKRNAVYMHDADGMVYPAKGQGRTLFQSPDKKHTAKVSAKNIYKIQIDEVSYTLDSIEGDHAEVSVFDDGSCLVEYFNSFEFVDELYRGKGYNWDSNRGRYMLHVRLDYSSRGAYYIKDGKVRRISKSEYFDRNELKIKRNENYRDPRIRSFFDEVMNDENRTYKYVISSEEGISSDDENFRLRNTDVYKQMVEDVLDNIAYNVWDKSHTHHLITALGWGYIYLDGMALKADYPLLASYNEGANAFRWVVQEGNEVVYYSYQIP